MVRRVIILALLGCGLLYGIYRMVEPRITYWIYGTELFRIKEVKVNGAENARVSKILAAADIDTGTCIIDVSPDKVTRRVDSLVWIKECRVARKYPNRIVITVFERIPIAMGSFQGICFIDKEGVLIPMRSGTFSNMPLAMGMKKDSSGEKVAADYLQILTRILDASKHRDLALHDHISEILFHDAMEFEVVLASIGVTLVLDRESIDSGFNKFERVVYTISASNKKLPRRIDVRYEKVAYAQYE